LEATAKIAKSFHTTGETAKMPGISLRLRSRRIHRALCDGTRPVCERRAHRSEGYTDPVCALEAFRADPARFDIVVTDLPMPEISGFDLARALRAVRSDVPVLMTTGTIDSGDEAVAREAGITQIVLKPVTVDEPARVLERLFGDVGAGAGV